MVVRCIIDAACALVFTFGDPEVRLAQYSATQPDNTSIWAHDFTVLTMAPDGSWGTATDDRIEYAISLAVDRCKAMSGAKIGCGAHMTSVRGGWSLGLRCGRHNIIVADRILAEAERQAKAREADLRERYVRGMPACVHIVTVDPNGVVVPSPVDTQQSSNVPEQR